MSEHKEPPYDADAMIDKIDRESYSNRDEANALISELRALAERCNKAEVEPRRCPCRREGTRSENR